MKRSSVARAGVVLATGGFQSNLEKGKGVLEQRHAFSGAYSRRLGMELPGIRFGACRECRCTIPFASITSGTTSPGSPILVTEEGIRGVNALAYDSIWVNMEGERFVNECLSAKYTLPALLKQPTGSYWAVFDSEGKKDYLVTGSGWSDEKVEHLVFQNEELTKTSETLEGLAAATSLPKGALKRTVTRFNRMVDQQKDTDFDRLAPDNDPRCRDVKSLDVAPFYAIRMYPLARKEYGRDRSRHDFPCC